MPNSNSNILYINSYIYIYHTQTTMTSQNVVYAKKNKSPIKNKENNTQYIILRICTVLSEPAWPARSSSLCPKMS